MPQGGQELTLSDGSKIMTDLYIPTFGLIPNSSYMPAEYLNAKGFVMVDENLKVKGAKDIWAIGDVSDVEAAQFRSCDRQSVYLAKALVSVLSNQAPLPYKIPASRMCNLFLGLYVDCVADDSRFHGVADWQECWDRLLWEYEASWLHICLRTEDAVH